MIRISIIIIMLISYIADQSGFEIETMYDKRELPVISYLRQQCY